MVDRNLLILIIIVLVPTMPAYIFFKFLPSQGSIDGPMKGLHVKLGGAFAGYFAVLLLLVYEKPSLMPERLPAVQVWEVAGAITDENDSAIEIVDPASIGVVPPAYQVLKAGKFQLQINTTVGPSGDPEYPVLNISIPNFRNAAISLDPSDSSDPDFKPIVDKAKHRITFQRIRLKSVPAPPYNPSVQLAAPLPPGKDYHE
jgi:hypothetical protein